MVLILYMTDLSPPVRAVLMTAKALNVPLEYKKINLMTGDQLKPEFLKLNPQHTVPTLLDNNYVIWDSHAIMAYLIGKFGNDDALYPKDLEKRAVIDQRMHFETGVLFHIIPSIVRAAKFQGLKTVPEEYVQQIKEGYSFLEQFLENRQWIAGDDITIADFSLIPTVTSLNILVPIDPKAFPKLVGWIQKAEASPCFEINKDGLVHFENVVRSVLDI